MAGGFGDETYSWMLDEVGARFSGLGDMAAHCADGVGCSVETATIWIRRYSEKGAAYRIVTDPKEAALSVRATEPYFSVQVRVSRLPRGPCLWISHRSR